MRARRLLILVLVMVLALASLTIGACGGDDTEAKAALSAALDKVEASMANFQKMDATSTVADIKAAKTEMAPLWADVVTAAKGVKDADVPGAEKAWTDLETAVDAVPDTAGIMEAATAIMGPVQALMQVETGLRALVPVEK